MSRHLFWPAVIAAALLLIGLGVCWSPDRGPPDGMPPTVAAPAGGPFELPVSSRNGALSLEDYRGRYLWIYFGYTSCPDACPMSLGWISGALSRLPPEWQGKVAGLLISVDPERDTAAHLRDYAAHFHPDIDAATGPHERLREIAARYGVFYQHTEVESALGYVVDHSSSIYLVGPDGALLEVYPHGTTSARLLEGLLERTAAGGVR